MKKKLVMVTATFEYVIVVDEESTYLTQLRTATNFAHQAAHDMSMFDFDFGVDDYEPRESSLWDNKCIPYNSIGDKTIGEYL